MMDLDIDILQYYIQNFALKHNLIQQYDIVKIELSDKFDRQDYDNIDGKKFVYLYIHDYDNIFEIRFGKIKIEKEYIEGEEYYSIEKENHFKINIREFSNNIGNIMDEVNKKCSINNFID